MSKVISPVDVHARQNLGIRPGDTVRVVQNIVELKKGKGADKKIKTVKNARKQTFEGLVLSVKHGKEAGAMFTVRATLSGVGVEKIFPLYSPAIDSIEIVKRSKVRRAKLYFIREKATKEVRRQLRSARMMNLSTDDLATPEATEGTPAETGSAGAIPTDAVAEEAKKETAA